jgi:hypothetical protein
VVRHFWIGDTSAPASNEFVIGVRRLFRLAA